MAQVLSGFIVTASLLGANGGTRKKEWELALDTGAVDDDAAFAVARAQCTAMISAFGLLTGATVTGYQLSGKYENDAPAIPAGNANVYKEAFLTVGLNASGSKRGSHAIPAPADGMFSGDDPATGQIDVGNPQTLTYLAYFAAPNFFRVSDGEEMLSTPKIQAAKLRSVGSGKSF